MAHTTAVDRPRQRDVNVLGLAVLVVYGVTYYAIGTAAPAIAKDLGVGVDLVFGAFSIAMFANAAVADHAGRLINRVGSTRVMAFGLFGRSLALLATTFAPDAWTFGAGLIGVMMFSQVTEYDVAFAAVVERSGVGARSGISQITLWGGIASTVFWPLTLYLIEVMSWRDVFRIFALLLAAMAVVIWLVVGLHRGQAATGDDKSRKGLGAVPAQLQRPFIWLTVALSLSAVAIALPVILMPVLTGLGFGATAALAGAIFGPAQTAARMLEILVSARFPPTLVAIVSTALLPLALLFLAYAPPTVATAVAFAVVYGAGNGVAYVNRGTVALQLFGSADYAALLGRIAVFRLLVSASMPFLLAFITQRFGTTTTVCFCAAAGLLATLCFLHLHRSYGR